jgi:N-terminal domain of NWD NACHT-NTPase
MGRLWDKLKPRKGSKSHPRRRPECLQSNDDDAVTLSAQAKASSNSGVSTDAGALTLRCLGPQADKSFQSQSLLPLPFRTIPSEPVALVQSNPSLGGRPSTQEDHSPPSASTPALKETTSSAIEPDLWSRAYKVLQERESLLVEAYERELCPDGEKFGTEERMKQAIKTKLEHRDARQFVISLAGKSVKIREYGEGIAKFVIWSHGIISTAISTQPYAALAWAGVSILLPVGS